MDKLEKILNWVLDNIEWLFSGVGVFLFSQIIRFGFKHRKSRRQVKEEELNELIRGNLIHYPKEVIERARENYIKPHCELRNPADINGKREDLFKTIDKMLKNPLDNKYIILLGETGTGKTAFVLNYYARYLRRRPKGYRLHAVPLSIPDMEIQKLRDMENQANAVLFLDALDEDVRAVRNHRERVSDLCRLASGFRCLLITCRTQFFPREEEEPSATDVSKIGTIRLGEEGEYVLQKHYLSLFNEWQVTKYLWRRYSFFHWFKYRSAKRLTERFRKLTIRPMILEYIDDLYKSNRNFIYSHQLYEEIVDAWFKREVGRVGGMVKKEDPLRDFCEKLAVELFRRQQKDGAEHLSYEEIEPLSREFRLNLKPWKASSRSLLIRGAGDKFKFVHRSIMEYLFVRRFTLQAKERQKVTWSHQMNRFLIEMLCDNHNGNWGPIGFPLEDIDVPGLIAAASGAGLRIYEFRIFPEWHFTTKVLRLLYDLS